MSIRQFATLLLCVSVTNPVYAVRSNGDAATIRSEGDIVKVNALYSLKDELDIAYKSALHASDPYQRENLARDHKHWIKFGPSIFPKYVNVIYISRIYYLRYMASVAAIQSRDIVRPVLSFKGIRLGSVMDITEARKVFSHFKCHNDKTLDNVLSSNGRLPVFACEGQIMFEHQRMNAVVTVHAGRRVSNIMLTYDLPDAEARVRSTSLNELENRLIAAYGEPKILRTQSPHQRVHYKQEYLVDMVHDPSNQGGDLWEFSNGASIVMTPAIIHQEFVGPDIRSIQGEVINFSTDAQGVSVTLPAQHEVPVVFTDLSKPYSFGQPMEAGELMRVQIGGEETNCALGKLIHSSIGGMDVYDSTIKCANAIDVGYSTMKWMQPALISLFRSGHKVAFGFIRASQAVANLQHP